MKCPHCAVESFDGNLHLGTCLPKTLRDEFAMAALTGMISTTGGMAIISEQAAKEKVGSTDLAAAAAYEFADAMLKAREQKS